MSRDRQASDLYELAEEALETIEGADCPMRENGGGAWRGRCPLCGNDDLTLRVDEERERLWVDCYHVTCDWRAVHQALGLTLSDLRLDHSRSVLDAVCDEGEIEPTLGPIPNYPTDALPFAARELVRDASADGLPAALVGGAALAAIAIAIGGAASVEVTASWLERAILWIVNLAPRGAGKSPSQDRALYPLRAYDAHLDEEEPTLRVGDTTLEAIARDLSQRTGQAGVDVDELVVLLRGLGEYKRGQGADRGRFLALWEGAPWTFSRVGGGAKTNKVNLRIPQPTLVVIGGLQPGLHDLLGDEHDGLRPRWLPHLAALPDIAAIERRSNDSSWGGLLNSLLNNRRRERIRTLDDAALEAFNTHRLRWAASQRSRSTSATLAAALAKADRHLARIALVLAEAERPGVDRVVGADVVDRAAMIVDFTLASWAALPEQGTLSLTYRDRLLDEGINRLAAWLEEHGGEATRRELARACVAGARTSGDLNALLERYRAVYPSCVTLTERSGNPTVVVSAPPRRAFKGVGTADTLKPTPQKPRVYGKSEDVGTADTPPSADTPNQGTLWSEPREDDGQIDPDIARRARAEAAIRRAQERGP